jgi:hypothetical protein
MQACTTSLNLKKLSILNLNRFQTIVTINTNHYPKRHSSTASYSAYWLGLLATNRKVAGSIPDGDIGIFHWHNPSDRNMALGFDSASNRNEYQVKEAGA